MISELPFKSTIPELGKIVEGVLKAGEKVIEVYETDFSTEKKDDDSPITQADIESNKILKEVLGKTGITILSEEDVDDKKRLSDDKIWIIDPLDGTTDFVNRTGEFTIMVGLVEKQKSVLGLIYWPTKKKIQLSQKQRITSELAQFETRAKLLHSDVKGSNAALYYVEKAISIIDNVRNNLDDSERKINSKLQLIDQLLTKAEKLVQEST